MKLRMLLCLAAGMWGVWEFWSMGPFSLLMGFAVFMACVVALTGGEAKV